jgi:hypothetical protein
MPKSVDTPRRREQKGGLPPLQAIARTPAESEEAWEMSLLKAFMGMVESWELHTAPDEAKAAFVSAIHALWAEGKRTKERPRLERERVAKAELLLQHRLAVEADGWIEIPCVTEGWETIEKHRGQTRKRMTKQRLRVSDASRDASNTPPLEITQVSRGTEPALKSSSYLPSFFPSAEVTLVAPKSRERQRSRRCPKCWQPDLDLVTLADNLHVDLAVEIPKLRDYEFATAKSDWDAVARNWVRKAAEMPQKRGASATRRNMSATEALEEYVRRRERGEPLFPDITATRTR